jgi:hypothetical protein
MRNRNCPWCGNKLDLIELLLLDELAPRKCKNCGKYLKTSKVNSIVSAVLPTVLCFISYYLLDIGLFFSAALLLLIPVLRISLAEPVKYSISSTMRICLQCKRAKMVAFSNPETKFCDQCLHLQKNQEGAQNILR